MLLIEGAHVVSDSMALIQIQCRCGHHRCCLAGCGGGLLRSLRRCDEVDCLLAQLITRREQRKERLLALDGLVPID